MKNIIDRFLKSTKAGVAVEYTLSLIMYIMLLLFAMDLMLVVIQWADIQRANALMGEAIKNRVSPVIASGYGGTWTPSADFTKAYCGYLIMSGLCKNITILTFPNIGRDVDTQKNNSASPYYCYRGGTNAYTCSEAYNGTLSGTVYSDPVANTHETILIRTISIPIRLITFFSSKVNSRVYNPIVFTNDVRASNFITLNN